MLIAYELTHASCDREIMRTPGHEFVGFSFLGPESPPGWDSRCRPRPASLVRVEPGEPNPKDRFGCAVYGTFRGAHVFHRSLPGVPLIWKCLVDFGRWDVPGDVEEWTRVVVFPCQSTKARWRLQNNLKRIVIHHGIDSDVFRGWGGGAEDTGAMSVGHFIPTRPEKGPKVLEAVNRKVPVNLVGVGNDGYPNAVGPAASMEELAAIYNVYRVYFNPSNVIVCSVLEAMASGMPVVTMTPRNFQGLLRHGENCLIASTPDDAVGLIKEVIEDDFLAFTLGREARNTIREEFLPDRAWRAWNRLFRVVGMRIP